MLNTTGATKTIPIQLPVVFVRANLITPKSNSPNLLDSQEYPAISIVLPIVSSSFYNLVSIKGCCLSCLENL